MVKFTNKKTGYVYETRTAVDKVPSSGKYRVQGWVEVIYPSGKSENVSFNKLTFNKRKDAEDVAKSWRKRFTVEAKKYAGK